MYAQTNRIAIGTHCPGDHLFLRSPSYSRPRTKAPRQTDSTSPESRPALAAARQQVLMLDDLYKTAVVLITEHYVNKRPI